MADLITELKERRVLPAVGVYAAGCWVLIEILDRLVERYLLSPYITDIVFWGLYSMIPAVVLIAWSYGRPGKDTATTAQKVGVPINIIATLGLLISLFGGKDLQPSAELVTVANEEGQSESHYIPKDEYRRRLAVFFYDNKTDDPELDWLQYGATELLVQDLDQDPFLSVRSPWDEWGNGFYLRMRQAGFNDGLDVPRSLMREIADDANRQIFIEGDVTRENSDFTVKTRVWDTESMGLIGELSVSGWDIYGVMDESSKKVRELLEVPVGTRITKDMLLAETYGESREAFGLYIDALNVRLFDNDIDTANYKFDEALSIDPNFVQAWFFKGLNRFESGDMPAAQASFAKASELDYRLPEGDRATIKAIGYRLSGETEKWLSFLRLQTDLSGDAGVIRALADALNVTGAQVEAREEYLRALEKDPLNVGIYLSLSTLERSMGNMEGAINFAKVYQEKMPDEETANLFLGDLLRDSGELDTAIEHYTQAQLLADRPVSATLRLADMALRKGDVERSRVLMEQAESAASNPLEQTQIRQAAFRLELRLGRLGPALQQIDALSESAKQVLPPLALALAITEPRVGILAYQGKLEEAEQEMKAGKEGLQPPLDQFLAFADALLFIKREQWDEASEAIGRGEAVIEQFDFEPIRFRVDFLRGEMSSARGEHTEAARFRESALQSVLGSAFIAELATDLPGIYAEVARAQVDAGLLDAAERSVADGMRMDPNNPLLWLEKARLQSASGMAALARASVQYALAIWVDADPEFYRYAHALELAEELSL